MALVTPSKAAPSRGSLPAERARKGTFPPFSPLLCSKAGLQMSRQRQRAAIVLLDFPSAGCLPIAHQNGSCRALLPSCQETGSWAGIWEEPDPITPGRMETNSPLGLEVPVSACQPCPRGSRGICWSPSSTRISGSFSGRKDLKMAARFGCSAQMLGTSLILSLCWVVLGACPSPSPSVVVCTAQQVDHGRMLQL